MIPTWGSIRLAQKNPFFPQTIKQVPQSEINAKGGGRKRGGQSTYYRGSSLSPPTLKASAF
jgi:hypothetical protein